jgi:cell division protein FtsZ
MGVGRGSGEGRVKQAVKDAIESPLLETSIDGAKAVLINVTGGYDLGMLEANEAASEIEKAADSNAIIIFGAAIKEEIKDEIFITVIATGFENRTPEEIMAESVIPAPAPVEETAVTEEKAAESPASQFNDDFKIPVFLTQK